MTDRHLVLEYSQIINTEHNFVRNYIGDRIYIKGIRYTVTANYARHGYLLAIPYMLGRIQKTVKINYGIEGAPT